MPGYHPFLLYCYAMAFIFRYHLLSLIPTVVPPRPSLFQPGICGSMKVKFYPTLTVGQAAAYRALRSDQVLVYPRATSPDKLVDVIEWIGEELSL